MAEEEGGITEVVLKTAPFDARFPYTNQTKKLLAKLCGLPSLCQEFGRRA